MLFPTRLVFEPNQRAAQVQVINRGTKAASYRISLVNRRMTETGQIVNAETALPGELMATDLVRFSPRQITIKPGESQVIRLNIRKPAVLEPGEYRSHLQFDRLPDAEGASDIEELAKSESDKFSVKISTLLGASIPVIVRHGSGTVEMQLDNLSLERATATSGVAEGAMALSFHMKRKGNRSVFGHLKATYTPVGSQPIEVGIVRGVAVYVPNELRITKLPLNLPEGVQLKGGVIDLLYEQRPEDGGKPIARASLTVP